MKCPNCEVEILDDVEECPKCGEILNDEEDQEDLPETEGEVVWDTLKDIVRIVMVLGGVASSVLLVIAGMKMLGIKTVEGNTIMETYYQAMGIASIGLACFTGPFLIGKGLKGLKLREE